MKRGIKKRYKSWRRWRHKMKTDPAFRERARMREKRRMSQNRKWWK